MPMKRDALSRSGRSGVRRLQGFFVTLGVVLAGCGGGDNPLGNPADITNLAVTSGGRLSFAYFQNCIFPIFEKPLQIQLNGVASTNTCAAAGCHDTNTGAGGAFRVVQGAANENLEADPAALRASAMYRNFYSSQGQTIPGQPAQSRLINKPLVNNVLHGGGLIFDSAQDPNVKLLQYWITHPAPQGQDEFSAAAGALAPADGSCPTQ
jgi:hypothetical protein